MVKVEQLPFHRRDPFDRLMIAQALSERIPVLGAHAAFVAVDADRRVGVCVLEQQGRRAALENLWIAPEYQRHGVGRALVARVLDAATRAGVAAVDVLSDPFAEPFYARLGARRVKEVPAPMPGSPDRVLPILVFELQPGRRDQG